MAEDIRSISTDSPGGTTIWRPKILGVISNPDKMQLVMVISNTHTDYNNHDSFPNKDHNQSASNG